MNPVWRLHDVPAPENVPPVNNPDPQPGDDAPRMPPSEDEDLENPPVRLPGKPSVPERVGAPR
jgi:hypothetical protein